MNMSDVEDTVHHQYFPKSEANGQGNEECSKNANKKIVKIKQIENRTRICVIAPKKIKLSLLFILLFNSF